MLRTIGLMSGTSLDGVDAAFVETDGQRIACLGPHLTLPYPDTLRADLRRLLDLAPTLCAPTPCTDDPFLRAVERRVTDAHATAVAMLDMPADLIGFHGQTILHRPQQRRTWQIGDAAALAAATGIRVAHDFRGADVAAGGQGAPLVPLFHAALAGDLPRPLAVLNLGGVANITHIAADGAITACDAGPGNGPLDDWVAAHGAGDCDRDGRISAAGQVRRKVLDRLMQHDHFARPWPKSLDRLDFGTHLHACLPPDLGLADGAATLVAFTAAAVAAAGCTAALWVVCGGGAHNPTMMRSLRQLLRAPVEPASRFGWHGDAIEAQCFGYLAARVLHGLPLSLPATTGVPHPMPGGRLTAGQGVLRPVAPADPDPIAR